VFKAQAAYLNRRQKSASALNQVEKSKEKRRAFATFFLTNLQKEKDISE